MNFLGRIYFCLGQPVSKQLCHAGDMKIKRKYPEVVFAGPARRDPAIATAA